MSGATEAPGRTMRDRLVRALSRERAAGEEGLAELHALPLDERVDAGDCLAGLLLAGGTGEVFELDCARNVSRFKAGDALTLGRGDDPAEGVAVVYEGWDPASGRLRVRRDRFDGGEGRLPGEGPLALDRRGSDFARVALDAVETVYSGAQRRFERIRGILERTAPPSVDPRERALAEEIAAGADLDDDQRIAFVESWARRDFHLVQGPPGSGKTRLAAQLVAGWARRGERVLVAAYTHRAVNNVLAAICREEPRGRPLKIGEEHHAEDLPGAVRRIRSARSLPSPPSGRGQVVGATLFALRSLWVAEPFDRVVFDEAAQIPVPHALCGMLAGRRYVFVGDHRQLGPIVTAEHDDEMARLSIFEHLLGGAEAGGGRSDATLLTTTYRMNREINAFPSRHFYGGKLHPAASCATARFPFRPGGSLDEVLDPARPAVFVTLRHVGYRTHAPAEARLVADLLVDLLVRQRIPAADLAVVTPWRAQVQAIGGALGPRLPAGSPAPVIDTVERMQGQEREAVIVSLACSDAEYAAREAAFLFSPNRLNVTLTRARTKLVVIASPVVLEALPSGLDELRDVSLVVRLHEELPRVDLTGRYLEAERDGTVPGETESPGKSPPV